MKNKSIRNNGLEVCAMWTENVSFDAHSHNELVLSCNLAGNEALTLDGTAHIAPQKHCTLYNPGQIQAGSGAELIISLYVQPEFVSHLLSTNSVPAFDTPVVDDPDLHRRFAQLFADVLLEEDGPFIEESAVKILDGALARYTKHSSYSSARPNDWRVVRIQDHLMSDLSITPTLDELAQDVGLEKLKMMRLFTRATGVPPITWQRYQRIAIARQRLREGHKSSEVAYDLGFSDQPHLTRLFKAAYGISPAKFSQM